MTHQSEHVERCFWKLKQYSTPLALCCKVTKQSKALLNGSSVDNATDAVCGHWLPLYSQLPPAWCRRRRWWCCCCSSRSSLSSARAIGGTETLSRCRFFPCPLKTQPSESLDLSRCRQMRSRSRFHHLRRFQHLRRTSYDCKWWRPKR